eukprot:TRINITY_DN16729_c0_g1_i1.p1 TRINITY_DN16729_c0_g1~~TRINITY_DN16729_c0_g1_i1.p1  ORF type:complete len:364 (-),score=59.04 TRINITY_DN16729_c0_g1_i1:402-1493(-)
MRAELSGILAESGSSMVKRKAQGVLSDDEESRAGSMERKPNGHENGAGNDDTVSSNERREPGGGDPNEAATDSPMEEEQESAAPMEVHRVSSLRGGRAEESSTSQDWQASNPEGLTKQGSAEIIAHFDKYADTWFHEYRIRLEKLKKAISDDAGVDRCRELVEESVRAIVDLFAEKSRAVDADVLHVMAGLWRTPLEVSFLWNGGLRPTTLFQLIYHMVGSQIENSLGLLLSGGAFPPMASLTGKQLEELSSMQLATTKIEDSLSDESASLQMNLADLPLPGLADPSKADPDAFSESIKAAMHERLVSLKQLVHQGDHLRLKTVKEVLAVLTWRQQVELLAGMSELVLALRKIGEAAKVKTYL